MEKQQLGKRIVVLSHGFVHIGDVESDAEGITIRNTRNIRRYGTEEGLGELVNGPKVSTVLDPVGTVHAPWSSVVFQIEVNAEKWQ